MRLYEDWEEPGKIKEKTKKRVLILWSIFPILAGIFFTYTLFLTLNVESAFPEKDQRAAQNEQVALKTLPPEEPKGKELKEIEGPKYFYTNKDLVGGPRVSAKAYIVGDLHTGEVIISKNHGNVYPIASVSKLMTALVATELAKDTDVTTVSKRAVSTYGQNGELRSGEKIKTKDLLYPLLLESSNDAAEALAETFGRDAFLQRMNAVAKELQMENTSFKDPSGLSSGNRSSASDIFKLTGYLSREYPDLLRITTKRSHSTKKHNWSNISQFLGREEYIGGKSGYTDEARQTVVSLFSLPLGDEGERPIAITLLQSNDRKKDVENIVSYLRKNVYYGGAFGAIANWVEDKVNIPVAVPPAPVPVPVPLPVVPEPPKDPDFVTLAFGGDIMLDRGVRSSVVRNFGNDYSSLFAKSKEFSELFKNSDIAFGNLEGPASDQGKDLHNLYSFRMDPGVIPALKGAGISILSVANNHMGDWGVGAYADTLARLRENEIHYTGGGTTKQEAETPAIIEKYGIKVGFLAFSDVGPSFMEAGTDKAGVLLANDPHFDEIIQNGAKQVDHLIVSFHFGDEYKTGHNERQEYLAHRAVDNGAKIVVGHHPHVAQDTEIYKNSYIAYSLGNFIFDQSWSKDTMKGMLLGVKLSKDGSMSVKKYTTELNSVFQIEKITPGKEEIIKIEPAKTASTL